MNVLDIFENIFRRKQNNYPTTNQIYYQFEDLGGANWSKADYTTFAKEGYEQNVIAHRCIDEHAAAIGAADWEVYVGRDEQETHPLLTLLERPNPMQGGAAFFQTLDAYKQISGNSFILVIPDAQGVPRELYVLHPNRMRVVPGNNMIPKRYEYKINDSGETVKFPVDQLTGASEILHFKTFNPLNHWVGLSPMAAAAKSIDLHNDSSLLNLRLLKNGARPSGALVFDKPLTDEQRIKVKRSLKSQYQGAGNAEKPMVLEAGVSWQEMGLTPKDMQFVLSKQNSARDIATAFRIPPILLNIGGDTTFANMKEARMSLYEDTIIPELNYIRDELNNWLVPMFGDNIRLEYDIDDIPALAPKRKDKWDTVSGVDFLTINEKREAVGYASLGPEGDVIATAGGQTTGPAPAENEPPRNERASVEIAVIEHKAKLSI